MKVNRDRSVIIACIGAGSALLAALVNPICNLVMPKTSPPASPPAVVAGEDPSSPVTPTAEPLEGAWRQYVLTADEGDLYLGTFVVSRLRGEYVISPRSQNEGKRYVNTLGLFDVNYRGDELTFSSNWGGGNVGNFALKRISPTVFEGEIRVAGKLSNRTRIVKVE